MKQVKEQEIHLTRADLITFIAERDRQQKKSISGTKAATKKQRNPSQIMASCIWE